MIWKDTTGYSQGRERIPTTWSAKFGVFGITVTSSHIHYKGQWIARCEPFFDVRELDVSSKEEAQAKAIALVREFLNVALYQLA